MYPRRVLRLQLPIVIVATPLHAAETSKKHAPSRVTMGILQSGLQSARQTVPSLCQRLFHTETEGEGIAEPRTIQERAVSPTSAQLV